MGLLALLRPNDDIRRIYYSTTLVTGHHRGNPQTFLNALSRSSRIEIVLGKFLEKTAKCRVTSCTGTGSPVFKTSDLVPTIQRISSDFRRRRSASMCLRNAGRVTRTSCE